MSHYDTLGVAKGADAITIKRAYRKRAAKAHPDRPGGSHQAMVVVDRAYKTLSDPEKRAHYDQTGEDEPKPHPPLDVKATQLIVMMFGQFIEQATDTQDVVEAMRQQIRENQRATKMKVIEQREKIKILEKRKKRIKYTGKGHNLLLEVLQQKIDALSKMAGNVETEAKEVGDRAIEMLREFAYEADAMPPISRMYSFYASGVGFK